MKLDKCSREQFAAAIDHTNKADTFARTFLSKGDMLDKWENCVGAFDASGELMGAVIQTYSKRLPSIANLQLLHTFAKHRRLGVGKALMEFEISNASKFADYFRVSSEPSAVPFYESLGLHFWGKQKSGCSLCMFRFDNMLQPKYNTDDPYIRAAVFKKGKGGVVELNEQMTEWTIDSHRIV